MATPLSSRKDITKAEREETRLLSIEVGVHEDGLIDCSELTADANTPHERMVQREEALLALGHPVAAPYGDRIPEVIDETQDVPELAITSLQIEQLALYLAEMDPTTSRVMKMYHGVFGTQRCNQPQIAKRLGISIWKVRALCDKGMTELRARFAVDDEELDAVRSLLTEMAQAA